ncbi:hypothetical protein D3C76_547540 [compost metagenome]
MAGVAGERVGQAGHRHIVTGDDQAALGHGHQLGNVLLVLSLNRGAVRAEGLHISRHERVPDFEVVGVAEQVGLNLAGSIQLEQPQVPVLDVAQ